MNKRRGAEEAEIADCSCEGMVTVEKKEKKNVTSSPHRRGVRLTGSQFIHPSLPVSSFSLPGRGPSVEGFTSGRPDPRPAERAIRYRMMLYKYIPPTSPAASLLRRELAATFFLKEKEKRKGRCRLRKVCSCGMRICRRLSFRMAETRMKSA